MSRALRRQKTATPKERPTPARGPSPFSRVAAPTRGQRPTTAKRKLLSVPRWLEDTVSELRKVTWPTLEETRSLAIAVIVVALAVGAALGLIDIFFNWLID